MKAPLKEISSTELARNLASTIDQVRLSGQIIEITKGNQTVARLAPPVHKGFPITELKHFFEDLSHLEKKDNKRMANDLKMLRDNSMLEDSSWD